jgi:hypothetical protein
LKKNYDAMFQGAINIGVMELDENGVQIPSRDIRLPSSHLFICIENRSYYL